MNESFEQVKKEFIKFAESKGHSIITDAHIYEMLLTKTTAAILISEFLIGKMDKSFILDFVDELSKKQKEDDEEFKEESNNMCIIPFIGSSFHCFFSEAEENFEKILKIPEYRFRKEKDLILKALIMTTINNKSSIFGEIALKHNENFDKLFIRTEDLSVPKKEINEFLSNVNKSVYEKNSIPFVGRNKELNETIIILSRATKNNPIHVGHPGVGKTSIIEGLAKKINNNDVPGTLINATIYSLNLGALMAGAKFRGDIEERITSIIKILEEDENPILYIDEIHSIVGMGKTDGGGLDISNLLKPYLTNGKIKFIGATTYEEYDKYFRKDKALNRRFKKVEIPEPSIEDSIKILNGIKSYFEKFHKVKYSKEAIEATVLLSNKFILEKYLPDKAIDLLDEAGASCSVRGKENFIICKEDIEKVLSRTCNIPESSIKTDEIKNLRNLSHSLKNKIFGQDEAIHEVVQEIKIYRAGLTSDNKPISSLLFVGPTGTGKTELLKQLAKEQGMSFIKYDMSEYMEENSISKLIGTSAGYIGYEDGGLLVNDIRKNPHSVVLFDEIEKAHPNIFNALLQIMDAATLTDSKGYKADFRNCLIAMTSNAGANDSSKRNIGFGAEEKGSGEMTLAISKIFSPEFRNRLSKIIVFNSLSEEIILNIIEKELSILKESLFSKNIEIEFSDNAKKLILRKGMSKEYGARNIQRVISQEIKPLVVEEILFGKLKKGGICIIDENDFNFIYKTSRRKKAV